MNRIRYQESPEGRIYLFKSGCWHPGNLIFFRIGSAIIATKPDIRGDNTKITEGKKESY